jgi:hypothetical protein
LICCHDLFLSGAATCTRPPVPRGILLVRVASAWPVPLPVAVIPGERSDEESLFPLPPASKALSLRVQAHHRSRKSIQRRSLHRNRRHSRNPQDRIEQRPILRAQSRHLALQRPRIPRRRHPPPNLSNSHDRSFVPTKKSIPPFGSGVTAPPAV